MSLKFKPLEFFIVAVNLFCRKPAYLRVIFGKPVAFGQLLIDFLLFSQQKLY